MASKLTDLQIRNAKPRAARYTLPAGKGLTLLVMPDGAKYWRLRYRFGGRARWLSVGAPYPETTLKQAETEAFRLRAMLEKGVDPAEERAAQRRAERDHVANTFGDAAEAWHAFRSKAWNAKTAQQVREYLDSDILPKLSKRPLNSVMAPELGELVAAIEGRKAFDVAKKTRQWLKSILSYARANGWTTSDPAKDLAAIALRGPGVQNYPHLPIEELPDFLRALDADKSSELVKACAKLALLTGNRPGVTRTLRWSEVDLEQALWTIEKGREGMKRGYYHLTPLPRQAVVLLRRVHEITGTFDFVFIGRNDPLRPLSDGAVAGLFKRVGYRGKQTMHGFRHLLSTALNNLGYERDWVERQLAHGDPDKIRGTYNKAQYLEQRRKMMQAWADHLDELKRSDKVAPIRKSA